MEQLEKARARALQRLNEQIFEPVVVKSLNDIKYIISELDPAKNYESPVVPLSTNMEVRDGSKTVVYNVTASTKSKSKRDHLVEGLKIIQNRQLMESDIDSLVQDVEINGRVVKPPKLGNAIDGYAWVDQLIEKWLGAKRDGIVIYWELDDGFRYKYNIFEHKLTRIQQTT